MAQTHFLPILNTDLISSFNFNYYGTRIAVSSLDHHLYVLSSDPETGTWPQDIQDEDELKLDLNKKKHLKSTLPNLQSWTAHEGPILKVIWSEPPHEELLASSGTDGTIRIWEEQTRRQPSSSFQNDRSSIPKGSTGPSKSSTEPSTEPITQWRQQAILADSYGHVRDLAFSPSETSLKLASISTDNHLRLYECLESNSITCDSWNMIIDLDLSVLPPTLCSSVNHLNSIVPSGAGVGGGPFTQHPAFTSVRGFDPSATHNNQKHGFSSNTLTSPLSGLRANPTPTLSSLATSSTHHSATQAVTPNESSGGWSLTWCPETYWGDILAVSAGPSGLIRVIKLTSHSQWENFANLSPQTSAVKSTGTPPNPTGAQNQPSHQFSKPAPISSLAWSPACARDYHLIAAGHRDGRARIWKLRPPSLNSLQPNQSSMHWQVELDTELEDHVMKKPLKELGNDGELATGGGGGVGKCEWNVTGTVLSTSGSDGKVRIWKSKLFSFALV
ncbi:WD40-repeat-containing domain protein [Melampsora americana]|nr:WD40-repeat-containing domain protein [Melampsora americana]